MVVPCHASLNPKFIDRPLIPSIQQSIPSHEHTIPPQPPIQQTQQQQPPTVPTAMLLPALPVDLTEIGLDVEEVRARAARGEPPASGGFDGIAC